MKLVSGRPLDRVIADAKTLEERLALLPRIAAATDAIAYAHSQRLIHRDLKPANIIIGDFGETVVIDWGLAKELGRDDRADHVTTQSHAPGAPEQASGQPVDERIDVYALGAVLYATLAGASPYRGPDAIAVIKRVIDGPP